MWISATLITDWRLLLVVLMPRPRRPPKRPNISDVYPSLSVEFISLAREEDGRVTKKRILEKSQYDTRPLFDIDSLFPPAHQDPSSDVDGSTEPTGDPSSELKGDPARRAVSVSSLFCCHVTVG